MMNCAWWVLVLLLFISPLVGAGQTNPATAAKLRQQAKQQVHTRDAKQQQQQQQQRPLGTATKQQHVKVSGVKQTAGVKTTAGAKSIVRIAKNGEKLEQKIKTLQQELEQAKTKQAKLKEEQLKQERLRAEAEAKAKAEAPRVLHKHPIQPKHELDRPTNALRCAKNTNYFCINETTCCLTAQGGWGCCPKPGAVCCQDKTHCCPKGTTCDLKNAQCRGQQTSPLMKKINAVRLPKGSMVCPDHRSSCPDYYTCCPAPFGGYQCCPAPQAMCCPDKRHCCPHGARCDERRGRCDRGNKVAVPWFTKIPARPVAFGQIICPGGQFECPTGSSCCRLPSGDWGCCPIPQAVCCEDGEHCCPRGFSCNQKMGSCQKEEEGAMQFVQWIYITDKHGLPPTPPNTICPSGKYKCPSDQTCCARKGGLYGCCPFVDATCCSDEKHCCPKGYECDLAKSKCVKGKGAMLLLSTLRASLDIRVPTSYQQLQDFLNTGYLPAPSRTKSPVFSKLETLGKLQPQKTNVAGTPKQKQQVSQQQLKQAQMQPKLQKQQLQQQLKQQKPQLKLQQQQLKQQKPILKPQQQQHLKQQHQKQQQQQLKLNQQQQLKLKQLQQQQRQAKPNIQQVKKPVVQKKPVIQQAKVVNQTPQGKRQVQQNKPFINKIDLKRLDPKIAEASRKAKIAMAVTKNAQILRKLHSIDLNVDERPTKQVQIKAKPILQQKTQKGVLNLKLKPTLSQEQVKNMQKQHVKKMQQNVKQQIPQQSKVNVKNVKVNLRAKH